MRSLSALSGGLLHEIGEVALPSRVRRTALYQTMVGVALRFLIEEVGQVEGVFPVEGQLAEGFLAKRTASHGIELLGILTFHASPIWVLAALADATGGGRDLIREIAGALKEEGLLEGDDPFDSVEQVLDGLERTSAHLASTLNLPPLDTEGLRREWTALKEEVQSIPPRRLPALENVTGVWQQLERSAAEQGRSVFAVSSLMAVSALGHLPGRVVWLSRAAHSAARRTGKVLGAALLDHYVDAMREMGQVGFVEYWRREFRPYLRAAAQQFAPAHESATERLLDRLR